MGYVARPRWLFAADPITKKLWDAGFTTGLIRSVDYKPSFAAYEWWRKTPVSTKEQDKRLERIKKNDQPLLTKAALMSASPEVDTMAMLLAIDIARDAIAREFLIQYVNLGEPDVIRKIYRMVEEKEPDLIVASNFTINSTKERMEQARDFLTAEFDAVRLLVAVGQPMDLSRKLFFNRFAMVFFQDSAVYETRSGDRAVRRVTKRSER